MIRISFAAAALLFAAACAAQTNVQTNVQGNAAAPRNEQPSGVFLPAGPEQTGPTATPASIPATAMPQASAVFSLGKEYRVVPNDLLDVEVLNLDNGKRTVRVNQAGYVTLPLIGPVVVAGLTQQQVEARIAGMYGEKYLQDPQVSVFIREFTTERITIDGAVAKPGIYPLVGQMTLLRALALAGGFGQIANKTAVKVFRRGENGERKVATFDIERIRTGEAEDPSVRGDDVIVVQRDSFRALLKDSVLRDVVDSMNPFSILSR